MQRTVLLVDDEMKVLQGLRRSFRKEAFQIQLANSGREALDLLSREKIDLVLSDIDMPGMSGIELLMQVHEDYPETGRFILTGKATLDVALKAINEGSVQRFFIKPCNDRQLLSAINDSLEQMNIKDKLAERESRLGAIGSMTCSIVHDLRNPLNALFGMTEMIRIKTEGLIDDLIDEELDSIISESDRLNRMICEILDLTKGQDLQLSRVPTQLLPYLETMVKNIRYFLEPRNIKLILDHRFDQHLKIDLDQDRFRRAIENLVKNSMEVLATQNNSELDKTIWLTTQTTDRKVLFRVADNGSGIPEELKDNLFDLFATTNKKSGTGIGLATVKTIVEAHGGEISVEGNGPEGGAAFVLALPLASDQESRDDSRLDTEIDSDENRRIETTT